MNKFFNKVFSFALCIVFCFSLTSCKPKKDKDYLYDWLIENGELVGSTTLSFEDSIDTNHRYKLSYYSYGTIDVEYFITDYEGYCVSSRLPLFTGEDKVSSSISLTNSDCLERGKYYSHYRSNFQRKSPITLGDFFGDEINLGGYSFIKDGHFYVDYDAMPDDFRAKVKTSQHMDDLCEELSHSSLCSILDWLNETICPLADMELSDFGYEKYK